MATLQAFLLGVMVVLTPSMIWVAVQLWRLPDEEHHTSKVKGGA